MRSTPAQFATMLYRNIPIDRCPEHSLIVFGVLQQAAYDAQESCSRGVLISRPMLFWFDGRASLWARMCGICPQFMMEQFIKHIVCHEYDAVMKAYEDYLSKS